jgi:Hydrogenase formation hypA family
VAAANVSTAPELRVAARWNGRRIVDLTIANGRPQIAASLRGRPVAEARARIPLLFSICRCAQGIAAELACAAAGSGTRDSEAAPGTAATRRSEMIQEHLWRLLLDWPIALGLDYRPVADNKACECGAILRGVRTPTDCKLFGTACTPETPMGSCMVSSEGACAAHFNYGRFRDTAPSPATTA